VDENQKRLNSLYSILYIRVYDFATPTKTHAIANGKDFISMILKSSQKSLKKVHISLKNQALHAYNAIGKIKFRQQASFCCFTTKPPTHNIYNNSDICWYINILSV